MNSEPIIFFGAVYRDYGGKGKAGMLILRARMLMSRYFRGFQSRLAKVERQVLYAALSWKQGDIIFG